MEEDRLVKIPRCDWEEWRDLYKRVWPRHEIAYNTVQNYIDWSKHDRNIKDLALYSLNGTWRENGTFVIIDRISLFMHTLDESLDTLRRTLELVDWDYYYVAVMCEFETLLFDTFKKLNVRVAIADSNTTYFLPTEEALQLTVALPEGLSVGPLQPHHAKIINDLWPHRETGSEFTIERLIRWNASMGLFDERGNLLGWCLLTQMGVMGSLGVIERRKGYGRIVVTAFVKQLAQMGRNAYASILVENEPSKALFAGVGFRPIQEVNWIRNCERNLSPSAMEEDRLVEIPRCDWGEWRDLYKQDWPRHELAYNTVQNYIDWSKRDTKIKDLALYSLNGTWRENGTFVIIDRIDLYMHTLDESLDTLRRALELVDWDYYYVAVMCEFETLLFDTFKKLNVRVALAHPSTIFFLSKEDALQLSATVPEGLSVGPLQPHHAKIINDLWPHRETGSEFTIERLIRWNGSIGLFDNDNDALVRIPASAWEQLRDLYRQDWPRHEIAFNNVQNYIRWIEREPQISVTLLVYSLNGTWRHNGTYIIVDHTDMFMYTLDTSGETLKRMLLLLDWHHSYLMNMCLYRAPVLEVYRLHRLEIAFDSADLIYYLPQQVARHLRCDLPVGLTLKRIPPHYAAFIYNQWLNKSVGGKEYFIERLLRWNFSMGLFSEGAREPLAWCIRTQNGALGLLGVVAQRKGYGSLVIKALAQRLAEQGHSTYASVRRTNVASRRLFEKLGFRVAGEASWLKNMRKSSPFDGSELRKAIKA
uniref:N-acetyltransferase domain-containing protein n=1 Tax=Anopheles dirus TaxID=7168 RepID=A0A182MZ90_9DIPT